MSRQTSALTLVLNNAMNRGLNSAGAQVEKLSHRTKSAARSVHSSVSSFGDKLAAFGRMNSSFMIGMGGIGAAAYGVKKVFDAAVAISRYSRDLETAMSRVKASIGVMADKKMIPQLKQQALDLASAGKLAMFTPVEIAESQRYLIKSGMRVSEAMKSVGATLAIAGAEQINLGQAADMTTNIMSSFGLKAKDTTNTANMLAQASRTSNTNITELAEGAAQGAAAFKQAGGSLGEFLAIGGSLAAYGIKGGEFGTGVKSIVASLADLTPAARKALSEIGIQESDLIDKHGNLLSMQDQFRLIGKKLGLDRIRLENEYGKVTEESAQKAVMGNAKITRVLAKVFKKYQFGKAAILAQEAATGKLHGRIKDLNKQIGKGESGAAFEMVTEQMDNTEGAAIRLSSAWNGLMTTLGSPINSALGSFYDGLANAINGVHSLIKGDFDVGKDKPFTANFGVPMTGGFWLPEKKQELAPTESNGDTTIIFNGNNEFKSESIKKEVEYLTEMSFGF